MSEPILGYMPILIMEPVGVHRNALIPEIIVINKKLLMTEMAMLFVYLSILPTGQYMLIDIMEPVGRDLW